MKEIILYNGDIALIDDCDFDIVNKYKWRADLRNHTKYAKTKVHAVGTISMHRLIMKAKKGFEIDHINHNGLDNRRANLRVVTKRGNHWNRVNQSKHIGVQFYKGKWRARIGIKGKRKHLGYFLTADEAYKEYLRVAKLVDSVEGEAWLNFKLIEI